MSEHAPSVLERSGSRIDGGSDRRPRITAVRLLMQRFVGALGLLAVLACLAFYVILSQAQLLRNSALVRDLSGQQRSRVTRMGILIVDTIGTPNPVSREAKHRQLRAELSEFRKVHAQLLHGSPELNLPSPPSRVQQVFYGEPTQLAHEVDAYLAWYEDVLKVPSAELATHPILYRFRDQAIGDKLLAGLESLVGAWQKETEERLNGLQTTAYVGLGATFFVLMVTGLFVFAPLVRRVQQEAEKLSAANDLLNTQTRQLEFENQQRATMNAKLRESEERLELALHSSLDAVITINDRGQITNWSPQAEHIFGWSFDEARGQLLAELIIPPRYREPHRQGIEEFSRTGYGPVLNRRLELFAVRRSGEEFPVELSISPLRLLQGFEFCGFVRDITQRRQAEQAVQSLTETLEQRVAERSGFVKLLQDVAVIANEAESVDRAIQAVLDLISRYMSWPVGQAFLPDRDCPGCFRHASLWTFAESVADAATPFRESSALTKLAFGEGPLGQVIATRQAHWIGDLSHGHSSLAVEWLQRSQLTSAIAFPILVGREVVAVLQFFCQHSDRQNQSLLEVLAHVGTQLGRVVERRRFQDQLMEAIWQQQRNLGQELHDSVGQELTGLALLTESLWRRLHEQDPVNAERVSELVQNLRKTHGRVRSLARGLFPVEITAGGLQLALAELTATVQQQGTFDCKFDCPQTIPLLDHQVATHLFRITQEALQNAVKHAQARRIAVQLSADDSRLMLMIRDDGCGLDPANNDRTGMGLRTMRYRAEAIGAQLQVRRGAVGGTIVECMLPCKTPGR